MSHGRNIRFQSGNEGRNIGGRGSQGGRGAGGSASGNPFATNATLDSTISNRNSFGSVGGRSGGRAVNNFGPGNGRKGGGKNGGRGTELSNSGARNPFATQSTHQPAHQLAPTPYTNNNHFTQMSNNNVMLNNAGYTNQHNFGFTGGKTSGASGKSAGVQRNFNPFASSGPVQSGGIAAGMQQAGSATVFTKSQSSQFGLQHNQQHNQQHFGCRIITGQQNQKAPGVVAGNPFSQNSSMQAQVQHQQSSKSWGGAAKTGGIGVQSGRSSGGWKQPGFAGTGAGAVGGNGFGAGSSASSRNPFAQGSGSATNSGISSSNFLCRQQQQQQGMGQSVVSGQAGLTIKAIDVQAVLAPTKLEEIELNLDESLSQSVSSDVKNEEISEPIRAVNANSSETVSEGGSGDDVGDAVRIEQQRSQQLGEILRSSPFLHFPEEAPQDSPYQLMSSDGDRPVQSIETGRDSFVAGRIPPVAPPPFQKHHPSGLGTAGGVGLAH